MSNHTTELKAGLSHIAQLFDLGADAPIDHLQAIVGVKEERDDLKVNNSKQNKEINRLKKMLVKSRKENEKLKLLLIPMNDWQEKNGKCAYSFLIPPVGILLLFYLVKSGDKNENQYGDVPDK